MVVDPSEFPSDDELPDEQPIEIRDERDLRPLFVHSELDDMPLTSRAFRVYCHLVRRAGADGKAWPSHRSIGKACFGRDHRSGKESTMRRRAQDALYELRDLGLITIHKRNGKDGSQTSNYYRLTPRKEWKRER